MSVLMRPGQTVNISAAAMQNPSMLTPDVMKVTHYATPPSIPAAAAAAAAMHAGAQHQRPVQTQEKTGTKLDASSPLTMSPGSSPTPSPTGMLSTWHVDTHTKADPLPVVKRRN